MRKRRLVATCGLVAAVGAVVAEAGSRTAHVACDTGVTDATAVNRSRDVAIGPLVLLGARLTARHRREAFNGYGYKLPVTLPDGMTATLSVPRRERSRVGLVFTHRAQDRAWDHGVAGADTAVRFTSCAASDRPARTGWPGGLVVDRRRCATLAVKVAGGAVVRRRVPLGRSCASASSGPSQGRCPERAMQPLPGDAVGRAALAALAEAPDVYRGTNLSGARVVSASLAPASGFDYARVKCGRRAQRRTVVVHLEFPAMRPSASMSQGTVLVSRFSGGYRIWAQLH
jgi:hypothetical protein